MLSPSHEKFTNTHPSGGGDGVGVADGDVRACSVDIADGVDTGADGVDTCADEVDTGTDGVDTGADGVDTSADGVDTGTDNVDDDGTIELTCDMTH